MTLVQVAGSSVSVATTSGNYFVYYENGILRLNERAQELVDNLPDVYQLGPNVRAIMSVIGLEYSRVQKALTEAGAQATISTATWGLTYWEQQLGLPLDALNEDYTSRRLKARVKLGSRKYYSETQFVQGLAEILGMDVSDLRITLGNPYVDPYTVFVELPTEFYESPPLTAPTAVAGAAGSIPIGTYTYKVSFLFSSGETLPSPASGAVVLGSTKKIELTDIPLSTNPCLKRRIYRKETADMDYTLVGEISNNTTTIFTDNAISGTDVILADPTAKTSTALLAEDYISRSKPSHLHVETTSNAFRADINQADLDSV